MGLNSTEIGVDESVYKLTAHCGMYGVHGVQYGKLQYRVFMPLKYPVSIPLSEIQGIHSQECVFFLLHTKAFQHNEISLQKERGNIRYIPMTVIPQARVQSPGTQEGNSDLHRHSSWEVSTSFFVVFVLSG